MKTLNKLIQKWLVSNKLYSGIMWQPVWTRSWTRLIPISSKRFLKVFKIPFENEKRIWVSFSYTIGNRLATRSTDWWVYFEKLQFSLTSCQFLAGKFSISRWRTVNFSLASFQFLASELSISRWRVFNFSLVNCQFLVGKFSISRWWTVNFSLASCQFFASQFSISR